VFSTRTIISTVFIFFYHDESLFPFVKGTGAVRIVAP
jgi:hypothetical protein